MTPTPSHRTKKTHGSEWLGAMATLPAFVSGDGEPYRPEALAWMGADGAIVGLTTARPGELLALASESLQRAIDTPLAGRPHRPTRVRVASTELAAALRDGHPGLEVVHAPTPELDELLARMCEKLAEGDALEPSCLSPDVTPEAMSAFFKAAAALFRAKPWKQVPDDQCLFSVTIERLGVRDAAMSVIGQLGQSFGLILFSSLDAFEAYLDAAAAIEAGRRPAMPPHLVLNFERGAEVEPALRAEVSEYRWEVAGPNAYPMLLAVDEGPVARPPTAKEVTLAEAIAQALTQVVAEEEALRRAWDGREPVTRTLSVTTHGGEFDVTLQAPFPHAPVQFDPTRDILADLAALSRDDGELDEGARDTLEDVLLQRFMASPEATDLDEPRGCFFVLDLGARYLGHTVATLSASDLHIVLFELLPNKVSIAASAAREIVEEMRAFYRFLKREFGLRQADACLRVLGGDAVKRLEAALSDRSNFGVAKSLFMAGADAGFDMSSKEGIDAWMQSIQGKPFPPSIPLPRRAPPVPQKVAEARKERRKAARKARKKSR